MGNKTIITSTKSKVDKVYRTQFNRRHFLLGVAAVSVSSLIPGVIACSKIPIHDIHNQLSDSDFLTLSSVQNHLFPTSKDSPGAKEINAATYFTWNLTDPEKDPDTIKHMRKGIRWTNEKSQEIYRKHFSDLSFEEKEDTLRQLSNERYGEGWLSVVLTQIFEALLSDPLYGSNTKNSGWNWLDHQAGVPQPTKNQLYNSSAL